MALLTVCIPTYEMKGLGVQYLRHSFDMLAAQTFTDFDVVISDHSQDNAIRELCDSYAPKLNIHYHRNTEGLGSSSININNAIRHARGTLIKILFQDDFLYHDHALANIVQAFDTQNDHWLITACIHTTDGVHFSRPFFPRYTRDIHLGNNRISSPSVLTIKNDHPLLFDERLIWLMDVEYYKRLHDAFGMPKILNSVDVVNRAGAHQVSKTLATLSRQWEEFLYVLNKYEHGFALWYYKSIYGITHIIKRSIFYR